MDDRTHFIFLPDVTTQFLMPRVIDNLDSRTREEDGDIFPS
jgi:hypothetical protein